MNLLISQTTWEADHVLSLRLRCPDGAHLPRWDQEHTSNSLCPQVGCGVIDGHRHRKDGRNGGMGSG